MANYENIPVNNDDRDSDVGSRMFLRAGVALTAVLAAAGCSMQPEESPIPSVTASESAVSQESAGMEDPAVQARAAQIISTFENSTTEVQYGYAENIDDGRGITAGRAGFCSGTGDMNLVVKYYTEEKPANPLAKFAPRLEQIDEQFADSNWEKPVASTKGLDGLVDAWGKAAKDLKFREAQDKVFNELYLEPSLKRAAGVKVVDGGIHSAAGELVILDALIQHGEGTDPDGLPALMNETAKKLGTSNASEQLYVDVFLGVREQHLQNAANEETREGWADSVARVGALRQIVDQDPSLRGPLVFDVYEGDHYELPALTDE